MYTLPQALRQQQILHFVLYTLNYK